MEVFNHFGNMYVMAPGRWRWTLLLFSSFDALDGHLHPFLHGYKNAVRPRSSSTRNHQFFSYYSQLHYYSGLYTGSTCTLYYIYLLSQQQPYLTMANRTPVGKSQAQASQPTVADLASKNSTDNPLSTGQTSEAPSKGLTAPAGDQSSSLK